MFWRKSEAAILNEVLDSQTGVGPAVVEGRLWPSHSNVVRQVVAELRRTGFSPAQILPLILLIVDLIQTIGPKVREIVEEIRRRRQAA